MPADDVLAELEKANKSLHDAFLALNSEAFLVESTENLRQAREHIRHAGLVLQQQIAHLRALRDEL